MDALALSRPRRLSLEIQTRYGAGRMAVLDFGDAGRPVDLVFVHANGFNALTYRHLLAPLSGSMRIWAPDLRGHGATTLPADPAGRRSWKDHAADLGALLDQIGGPAPARAPVVAGHSMGGTSSLLAAGYRPERARSLVLFDPVIWPRTQTLMLQLPFAERATARAPIAVNALKRRARFDSREQAFAAYLNRGAFKGWPEAMLADYLEDGLVPDQAPDLASHNQGGVRLACAPAWEASNYTAQAHNPWRAMARFGGPIRILKGENGSTCSVPAHPRGLPHVAADTIPGTTHFLPMQAPDIARDALFAAVSG